MFKAEEGGVAGCHRGVWGGHFDGVAVGREASVAACCGAAHPVDLDPKESIWCPACYSPGHTAKSDEEGSKAEGVGKWCEDHGTAEEDVATNPSCKKVGLILVDFGNESGDGWWWSGRETPFIG